jgi:predicted transcriptional regulator of viral defense system
MRPAEFLATHPLFTRAELQAALQSRGHRAGATVTSHLVRWQRQGRVRRVKQGVYLREPEGSSAQGTAVDFPLLASRLAEDAVLAYHTALEVHGLAQSLYERLFFATWTKTKPLRFAGRLFVPVRPRAGLLRAGEKLGWTETRERSGQPLRVTALERTVVDVFDRPELAGGMEEVWRSCSAAPPLDWRDVERYAMLLGSRSLMGRLGYFLERHAEVLGVPARLLERLARRTPRVPVYMDRRRRGRLVARWNLIVPPDLLPNEEGSGDVHA